MTLPIYNRYGESLKEARESSYRLRIIVKTKIGPPQEAQSLSQEAEEIAAILGAIVRNTRRNAAKARRTHST